MTSRRIEVIAAGGPEVLQLVERAAPDPRPGQVRIRVQAAGVAFGDAMRRRGLLAPRRPFTPGYDVAGVVDAVGRGVEGVRDGDRVAAMMPKPGIGGYAEHVCVPAGRLVRVPQAVDPVDAVCLGLNYITAYQLIHRFARLGAGKRILVHGAAGGVGSALLDLGQLAGLEMYGTASAGKHALVRERGAVPIDYRSEDFVARIAELTAGAGVDAVVDGIGGAHLRRSYRALAPGGTLVVLGVSGDVDRGWRGLAASLAVYLRLKLRPSRRRVRFYAITVSCGTGPARCRDDWETLLAMHGRGEIHPLVGARLPLDQAARAHEMLDRAAVAGKIVLVP